MGILGAERDPGMERYSGWWVHVQWGRTPHTLNSHKSHREREIRNTNKWREVVLFITWMDFFTETKDKGERKGGILTAGETAERWGADQRREGERENIWSV